MADTIRNDALNTLYGQSGNIGSAIAVDAYGRILTADTGFTGTTTTTTPTINSASSTSILAANANRKYLLIQNNSAANIMINLEGAALTGIVPTSSNKGIVLIANGWYESPASFVSTSAITAYQTSGGAINTIVVVEG